jgi:hypothetical protein
MKKYQMVRRLKLTDFEIRVAIDALVDIAESRSMRISNTIPRTNYFFVFWICWKNNYIGTNQADFMTTNEVEIRPAFLFSVKSTGG